MYFYGAGCGADAAFSCLKKSREKNDFKGIIDSNKMGEWNGFAIQKIDCVENRKIPIVITARNPWNVEEIRKKLIQKGFQNIYMFNWRTILQPDSSFLEISCDNTSSWGETVLPHLEMHIADHCNLNCRGCAHFSPLFKPEFPEMDACISDIKLIKSKFDHIIRFYLLGGEPLLNPQILKYVETVKELLPHTNLWIVTNGLLLLTVCEEILQGFAKNEVVVSISEYQPVHKHIEEIKNRLESYQISYDIRPYNDKQMFNKPLTINKKTKRENLCISDGCVNIWHGKIARCPTLMYIEAFNKAFNQELPQNGIIDLNNCGEGENLLCDLKKEVPLCRYCVKNEIEWGRCSGKIEIEDFSCKD